MIEDDDELLGRYAREGAEEAFAEIVRRHVDLVYSAALRRVGGDAHRAKDVAQLVFTDLARKAGSLAGRPVLAGWLFTATRFAAGKIVRGEQRRRLREQEAAMMDEVLGNAEGDDTRAEWERLRPVIDVAMCALAERDREAVLLRFFENRGLAEIGARLGLNENAARMRVERALEKLRAGLARRGVTSTSTALGVALANQAVAAAPVGLAGSMGAAAILGASTTVAGGAAFFSFMALTKIKFGVAVAVTLAAGLGVGWLQIENDRSRVTVASAAARIEALEARLLTARAENEQTAAALRDAQSRSGREARVLAEVVDESPFSDPEFVRNWKLMTRRGAGSPTLFRRLNLDPHEVDQLIDLLVERPLIANIVANRVPTVIRAAGLPDGQTAGLTDDAEFNRRALDFAAEDVDRRIRDLLGESRYALYRDLADQSRGRGQADNFAEAAALRGISVTDEQLDAMRAVFAAEGASHFWDAENGMHVLPEKVVEDSAAILNRAQLEALREFREQQVAEQTLKEMNRVAAGQGLLNLDAKRAARYRPAEPSGKAGTSEGADK